MRFDDAVDLEAGIPTAGRRLVEVRAELCDQLLVGERRTSH
jgi:hypothetical protein